MKPDPHETTKRTKDASQGCYMRFVFVNAHATMQATHAKLSTIKTFFTFLLMLSTIKTLWYLRSFLAYAYYIYSVLRTNWYNKAKTEGDF